MSRIGWVMVLLLLILQIGMALELYDLSASMKRIQSIDEETAMMRNEAAAKSLESEKVRYNYYRVLENTVGPMPIHGKEVEND